MSLIPTKWTDDVLAQTVLESRNWSDLQRRLGCTQTNGTAHRHIKKRVECLGLSTDHFKGRHAPGSRSLFNPDSVLVVLPPSIFGRTPGKSLRRAMQLKDVEYACAECKNPGHWRGVDLLLHVDHIDGDWHNNLLCNLRFLCPNCHSAFGEVNRGLRATKPLGTCSTCGGPCTRGSLNCQKHSISKFVRKQKGTWPASLPEIEEDVLRLGWREAGRKYGVSDTAVRKRVKKLQK
jgi:hypothetical protein